MAGDLSGTVCYERGDGLAAVWLGIGTAVGEGAACGQMKQ